MDQTELPTWLTENFLEQILSLDSEPVTVKGFEVKSAVPRGNNYVCDVLRVKIEYSINGKAAEGKTKSLIMKVPKSGGLSNMLTDMGVIQKEVDIYRTLIPKLAKIYGENVFTAKEYQNDVPGLLIFEDLNGDGWQMADRFKQLDYDHAVLAVKALARFHGASVKCHEEDPQLVESLGLEPMINEQGREKFPQFLTAIFQVASDELTKDPTTVKYAERFLEYKSTCWNILIDMLAVNRNNFNVLNHGDCWTTNMLFKYDVNGKPKQVKLIDFQVAKYNTPAIDLSYLFTGSLQYEVFEIRNDELLSEYLNELNCTLERCDSVKRLQMEELKHIIDIYSFYALFVSLSMLPMTLLHPDHVVDIKDLNESDLTNLENVYLKNTFNNPLYRKILPKWLKYFEQKGLF